MVMGEHVVENTGGREALARIRAKYYLNGLTPGAAGRVASADTSLATLPSQTPTRDATDLRVAFRARGKGTNGGRR
jgi:hypothetical protein